MKSTTNEREASRPAWMKRLSYERRYYWTKQRRTLERTLLEGFPSGVCVISLRYAPGQSAPADAEHTKRVFDLLRRARLRHGGAFRYVWTLGTAEGYPVTQIAVEPFSGACEDLAALWTFGPASVSRFPAGQIREAAALLCRYIDTDRAPACKRKWTYSKDLGQAAKLKP